jgi:cytochrome d ubiquinol oxidase subunit II
VVIGASLFAAFPTIYAVFLAAFHFPVLLLLVGLIFRGVAFEFRYLGSARDLWDWGFFLGSTVVAFVQGAAVGAMIRGIPVVNGQYAGGSFDWVAPLPVFCGIGLVFDYALLSASWLVLKSEGALRDSAWLKAPRLAGTVLVVLALATVASIAERDLIIGTVFLGRLWGLVFPAIGLLAMLGIFKSARTSRDGRPFAMTVLFFVASFATLAVLFWPYMIPYSVTVGSAARGVAVVLVLRRRTVRVADHRSLQHCRLLDIPRQDAWRLPVAGVQPPHWRPNAD